MKEKLKNKKVVYTIIGIVSVLLVMIAVTYAYWLVTKTQTGENEISSACLDISISGEKNDIELINQFPMSDEDGMKLVPYEFTVTNNCNTSVDYQVALEATGNETNALSGTSLKVALNNNAKLYSAYSSVETTIDGAYESRVLGYSKLSATGSEGSSDTYSLRIWIDADAPISEMNKTFKSRISVTIGQGIESGFEEGTLAYNILSNYGGANSINELQNNYSHRIISNKILENHTYPDDEKYYFGTKYIFDEVTQKYVISGDIVLANLYECRIGHHVDVDYDEEGDYIITKLQELNCGNYTLMNTSSTYESGILYEITNWNKSQPLITPVVANYIKYTTPLSQVATSNEGLNKTSDDYGDSYYFRGDVTNNYVQFGSYVANSTINGTTYAKETPMYWRIVRINGDGTIRMIYDGVEKIVNSAVHNSTIDEGTYIENEDFYEYVDYMYNDGSGNLADSTIKETLDNWYDLHLKTKYGKYISDEIFCNDTQILNYFDYDNEIITTTKPEGEHNVNYVANNRLGDKSTLKCTDKKDRYTVNDTINGNGLLSNPVGLITADEVVFAGGLSMTYNYNYYLYSGETFWTMTPAMVDNGEAIISMVYDKGHMNGGYVYDVSGVRPVINLKADVEFTGTGTIDDPYVIVTE